MNREDLNDTSARPDDDLGTADLDDEDLEDEENGGVSGRSGLGAPGGASRDLGMPGAGSSGVLDDADLGDENTDTE
ncbi:MAG: hypothetical protein M3160_02015 [Candidatus Eremiobacteraeota bacterium]|nr:hypothetical protein [Candidatus Eremiobacteraeota bacterium]